MVTARNVGYSELLSWNTRIPSVSQRSHYRRRRRRTPAGSRDRSSNSRVTGAERAEFDGRLADTRRNLRIPLPLLTTPPPLLLSLRQTILPKYFSSISRSDPVAFSPSFPDRGFRSSTYKKFEMFTDCLTDMTICEALPDI